jgi:hypothetical protein
MTTLSAETPATPLRQRMLDDMAMHAMKARTRLSLPAYRTRLTFCSQPVRDLAKPVL